MGVAGIPIDIIRQKVFIDGGFSGLSDADQRKYDKVMKIVVMMFVIVMTIIEPYRTLHMPCSFGYSARVRCDAFPRCWGSP